MRRRRPSNKIEYCTLFISIIVLVTISVLFVLSCSIGERETDKVLTSFSLTWPEDFNFTCLSAEDIEVTITALNQNGEQFNWSGTVTIELTNANVSPSPSTVNLTNGVVQRNISFINSSSEDQETRIKLSYGDVVTELQDVLTVLFTSHTLTGTVRDSNTGDPVSGVIVSFGSLSATTDSDGSFSIYLGQSYGIMTDSLSIYKEGYGFLFIDEINLDPSTDTFISHFIDPIDTSSYLTRQITGTIKDGSGSEIPDGWEVEVTVLNRNGGSRHHQFFYNSPGYSINSVTFGSDCLLMFEIYDDSHSPQFTMMKRQVDLSALSTTLNISENEASSTVISLTADAVGNQAQLILLTPYGPLEEGTISGDSWTFQVATTENVPICNPFDYNGVWIQGATEDHSTYTKGYMSTSAISSIGTSAVLPSLNTSLGPEEGFGPYPLSYSNGVLSFNPLTGAKAYYFILNDVNRSYHLGTITVQNTNVVFPDWLTDTLNGLSVEFNFMGVDFDMELDISMFGEFLGLYLYNMKASFSLPLGSTGPGNGYVQTINF